MGDVYKQVGGWKGIQKDILFPLAKYQKGQGMNTSFTRLYDAYMKVKPYWEEAQKVKSSGGGAGTGATKALGTTLGSIAPLGTGEVGQLGTVEQWYPNGDDGLGQISTVEDSHRELTKRLRSYFRRPSDRWEQGDASYPDLFGGGDGSLQSSGFRAPLPGEKRPGPFTIPKPPWMILLDILRYPGRKPETTWTLPEGGILYSNDPGKMRDPWAGGGS